MSDMIDDNRFVMIEKYKQRLIEGTNISDNPEDMAAIDSILFRFWQMGWLDKLEEEPHWIPVAERLPEVNGRYLVTRGLDACGAMWNRVYLLNYSDLMGIISKRIWWDGNVGKSDFERIDDVLAWMPKPEPWKGVRNE